MVWGLKNVEHCPGPLPRNITGERIAIHAGKREPRPTEWNIEVQHGGGSHSMPMDADVATTRLIECLQVMCEPDSSGIVNCRDFGELGDKPEYEATITADPYGDFSMGRWLWVFQDLRRVEPVSINGRQGVWTLPAAVAAELAPG
ncbi:MAG: hypothetical protein OXC95_08260 [Dehalococcoidia bacterium]|nr:hypothetical protein [Dehalococcoidia bacterium]